MRLVAALVVLALVGCGSESDDSEQEEASSADAIVGGKRTFHEPAVGVSTLDGMTGCSGSLIRPNVIIFAGHCFSPGRTDVAPWKFQIRKSATETYDFETGAGWVKGRSAASDDIGMVRLQQSVAPEIAKPIPIAKYWPLWGTKLQMIGFGCIERDGDGIGAGTKRMLEKRYSPGWNMGWVTQASCPGDSGGALIDSSTRSLLGVISGWTDSGYDIFGDVVKYREEIEREADRLAQ
jgi:hypothetical protein